MTKKVAKIQVFAVVRYESDMETLEWRATVKEILPSKSEADREVERLNRATDDPNVTYFSQATRYYPSGRGAGVRGLKVVPGSEE